MVFAFVARAVLAMSNLQLGGWILLGVQDDGQLTGLLPDDLGSWLEHDEVTAGLNAYADPFVRVDVDRVDHDNKSFIAIRVHEFAEVPVLARKDSPAKSGGNPAGCTDNLGNPLTTDQRGMSRPVGPRCDIGALEYVMYIFMPLIRR